MQNPFIQVANVSLYALGCQTNLERFFTTLSQRLGERHGKTWLSQNPMRFNFRMLLTPDELAVAKAQLLCSGWMEVEIKQGKNGIQLVLWSTTNLPSLVYSFSDKLEKWVGCTISNRVRHVLDSLPLSSFDDFALKHKDYWLAQPGIGPVYLEEILTLQYLAKRKVCITPVFQSSVVDDIAWKRISDVLL